MRVSRFGDAIAAGAIVTVIAAAAAFQAIFIQDMSGSDPAVDVERSADSLSTADFSAITASFTARWPLHDQRGPIDLSEKDQTRIEAEAADAKQQEPAEKPLVREAKLETDETAALDYSHMPTAKRDLSFLRFYVYSEIPLEKPANIVLDTMKDVPLGTPVEEIKRASDAFGLNFNFMRAVAKVESDFDPKQRTGSYIGLFQLSRYEFAKYGSGEITNARDNAVAAAYKFLAEATMFEWWAHKRPTMNDLYLIHQQGWQGAAEHIAHPEWVAWKSMCATDEGKEKGERWCKRAIWGNTLPSVKHVWKSVDNLTSGEFVSMWRQRINSFYARYSEASASEPKH